MQKMTFLKKTASMMLIVFLVDCVFAEVILDDTFQKLPQGKHIKIVESNCLAFPKAIELTSEKESEGKVSQGSFRIALPVLKSDGVFDVDYAWNPIDETTRYGLLINGDGKNIVTVIQEKNVVKVHDGKNLRAIGKIEYNKWVNIRYRINFKRKTFDVFIDNMDQPVATVVPFRNPEATNPILILSFGNEKAASKTLFGPVAVKSFSGKNNPVIIYEAYNNVIPRGNNLSIVEVENQNFKKAAQVSTLRKDNKASQGTFFLPLPKIGDANIITVNYFYCAVDSKSRYALFVSDSNKKQMIAVIQENGKLNVFCNGVWSTFAKIEYGRWYNIEYRINLISKKFSVYIDDMKTPVVSDIPFRTQDATVPAEVWSLGNQDVDSQTLLGPIRVETEDVSGFPATSLASAPVYLASAPVIKDSPSAEDFLNAPECMMGTDAPSQKEAGSARFLRDEQNLYVLFTMVANDLTSRKDKYTEKDSQIWRDDAFELFLQTDINRREYFHFVGNRSGALYDSFCNTVNRDKLFQSNAKLDVQTKGNTWTALLTIPLKSLGIGGTTEKVIGMNVGRNNPHVNEISSWSKIQQFHNPQGFGKLYLPGINDQRSYVEKTISVAEKIYDISKKQDELEAITKEHFSNLPEILNCRWLDSQKKAQEEYKKLASQNTFIGYLETLNTTEEILKQAKSLKCDIALFKKWFAPGSAGNRAGYVCFVQSSITKVMRDSGATDQTTAEFRISGNEYASFQVVVVAAPGKNLGSIAVSAAPMVDVKGATLAGAKVNSYCVRYLATAMPRKKKVEYPDILVPSAEFIADNAMQPIWLDVYLPENTPKGSYQTTITITPKDMDSSTVPVTIEATGLTLPKYASLNTAFCFEDSWVKEFYGKPITTEQKKAYIKFIHEHRLEPMNLWGSDVDIGLDVLDYAVENGKTMLFLRIDKEIRQNANKYRELIAKYQGKLRPIFFGYDEILMSQSGKGIPAMIRDYGIARELFPNIPRLNTSPIDERLFGSVDIWCPLFNHLDAQKAQERIALGEQLWWYPTDYPPPPFANFNLDNHGIDPRIIPWVTWKLKLTGILYWGLNREWMTNAVREASAINQDFIEQRSITWMTPEIQRKMKERQIRFPEIPWLPYFRSVVDTVVSATNGGGNLLYPAPDGSAWPSTRLKNLRDGMQDYEYFVMLRNNVSALKKINANPELISKAKSLLDIDKEIVGSTTSYTKDAKELLAFRGKLIDAILETNQVLQKGK